MNRSSHRVPDQDLWDAVARTAEPLAKRKTSGVTLGVPAVPLPRSIPTGIPLPRRPDSPPPLTGLDRRTQQKLMRGNAEIEARLDLHGETLAEAHRRLRNFIERARRDGLRTVLVITGKGASPFAGHTLHGREHFHAPERQGRLRRALPDWLHDADLRAHVSGFQPAHPRHGGGGAFYVRLRRNESR